MTKKEFMVTIRETEKLLINFTHATHDFDLVVMDAIRGLEIIMDETENSTDVYHSKVGERDCLVFDTETEQ